MKYLSVLLFLFLVAPAAAQNEVPLDAISNYFSEYVDDERFTVVYVSGKMMEFFDDGDLEINELDDEKTAALLQTVRELRGLRVLSTDETPLVFYEDARKRIDTRAYELLFRLRTKEGNKVEAFVQPKGAPARELLLLVGAEKNFTLVSFVGNIDLERLGELRQALE
ncbi:DUF4252 domain-containing protein [Neolewinella sp.]|uniref:DUF4252 domain-containing protein n=1 Tax=Neolewinella sp. TaxID=2993543 RepID=UPI003B52EAD3